MVDLLLTLMLIAFLLMYEKNLFCYDLAPLPPFPPPLMEVRLTDYTPDSGVGLKLFKLCVDPLSLLCPEEDLDGRNMLAF